MSTSVNRHDGAEMRLPTREELIEYLQAQNVKYRQLESEVKAKSDRIHFLETTFITLGKKHIL